MLKQFLTDMTSKSKTESVNENELINALSSDMLAGAVLDVFEEEPLKGDSPLWEMENVIITPHNSFVSDKTSERLFNVIRDFLK